MHSERVMVGSCLSPQLPEKASPSPPPTHTHIATKQPHSFCSNLILHAEVTLVSAASGPIHQCAHHKQFPWLLEEKAQLVCLKTTFVQQQLFCHWNYDEPDLKLKAIGLLVVDVVCQACATIRTAVTID